MAEITKEIEKNEFCLSIFIGLNKFISDGNVPENIVEELLKFLKIRFSDTLLRLETDML